MVTADHRESKAGMTEASLQHNERLEELPADFLLDLLVQILFLGVVLQLVPPSRISCNDLSDTAATDTAHAASNMEPLGMVW